MSNRQTPDTNSRDDAADSSKNEPARSYYYDDAAGYEVYDSEVDDEEPQGESSQPKN